ncbi:hypothetical protein, partial [Vibrio rotiferianus]|uniref:hypothetical protein n=1 Tax=Vibrio rotiferianus TaxID=190895 RepID=UPI0015F40222
DSNNDGSLENNEVDGLVDVLVTLPANAEVGDTLSVTGQPDRVITQNDLDNGVTLQYPVPAEGETLTVVATITDQAGNTSEPGQDAVTVPTVEVPDTDAPDAPTVVITEDSNNDGSLENNEVDGLVDVLVTLPANAEVGDTLSVTGQPDRVITQNDLDNGVTLQYPVPAEGETLTVVATITDQAGNTSPEAQDSVTIPEYIGDVVITTVSALAIEGESSASFQISRTPSQGEPTGLESKVTFKFYTSVVDSVDSNDIESVEIGDVVYTGEEIEKLFNDGIELTLKNSESISVVVTPKDDANIEGLESLVGQIVAGEGASILPGNDKANATINDETVDRNEPADVSIETVLGVAVEGETNASFKITRTAEQDEPTGSESKVTFKFDTSVADSVDSNDIESVEIGDVVYTGEALEKLFNEGVELTLTDAESILVVVTPKDDADIEGLENLVGQIVAGEGASILPGNDKANAIINDETVDRNEPADVSIETVLGAAVEGETNASFKITRTAEQDEPTGSESKVTFKFDTSVVDSVDINDIESVEIGDVVYTGDALKTLFNEGVELTLTDAESISVVVTPKDDADIEGLENLVGQIVAGEGASVLPGNDKANATINDETVDRNEPADVSIETVLGAAVEGETNASFKITRTAEQDEPTGSESTVTFKFATSVADSVDINDIESVEIGDVVYTGEALEKLFNEGVELTLTDAESISVVVTPKDDANIEGLESLVGQIVAGEGATIPDGSDKANATINDETVDRNEPADVSIETVLGAAVEGETNASFQISRTPSQGESTGSESTVTFKFDTSVADSVDINDIESVTIGETTYTGEAIDKLFNDGIELTLKNSESISVVVTPKDDADIEGLENLVGQIVAGEGASVLPGNDKANATINDETVDRNEVAEVSIKTVDAAAVEGESTASFAISRTEEEGDPAGLS